MRDFFYFIGCCCGVDGGGELRGVGVGGGLSVLFEWDDTDSCADEVFWIEL